LRRLATEHLLRAGEVERALASSDELLRSVGVWFPTKASTALASLIWQRLRLWRRGLAWNTRPARLIDSERAARCDALWSIASLLIGVDAVQAYDLHTRSLYDALELGDPTRVA